MIETPDRAAIIRVVFFKRDLLVEDLICCKLELGDGNFILWHEEMKGWDRAIDWLCELRGFDQDWFSKVSQPPFEPTPHVAYESSP